MTRLYWCMHIKRMTFARLIFCINIVQIWDKSKWSQTSIYFSSNTDVGVKTEVCAFLDIMTESLNKKYLGLPALLGAEWSDCFCWLIGWQLGLVDGRRRCLVREERKFLVSSLPRPCQSMRWLYSKFRKTYAKQLQVLFCSTGVGMTMNIRESVGKNDGIGKQKEEWDSGTYSPSTWRC